MIRKREQKSISSSNFSNQSLITNHESLGIFSGNWLVNYDPNKQNYSEILVCLAKISDIFKEKAIEFDSINIKFNKTGTINYFFKENDSIFLILNDINGVFEEKATEPGNIAVFEPLEKPIKTISLLFPRLDSDPRWKTMGLPAGHMLLASSLKAGGFEPRARLLSLLGENRLAEAFSADMTGITLFEDILPLLGPFLADFRGSHGGILAAGGPFPTLAPLSAVYHLPQVNLFVRGEAELALPGILRSLNEGNAEAFFSNTGVFWHQPGLIAMAGFDQVIRPADLGGFPIDLGFIKPDQLENGLEMNFSRGCRRGCFFCCRVQGSRFRKMPLEKVRELLGKYYALAENMGRDDRAPTLARYTVNINDDDILQDPEYAREVFSAIQRQGLRIFGIQTSTASLVKAGGAPNSEVLDMAAVPDLYVNNAPLLWLGTDAFLPQRARRLGKKLPLLKEFRELLREMERRKIRHFHYWISSDGDSTWMEFVEELGLIFSYFRDFPDFGLLAHAPFIVPYPSSALFARLPAGDPRLKVKLDLNAPDSRFRYRVVDRLETRRPQLNNLLRNGKAGGTSGFFDFLKEKDLIAATQLAYHFLKQEMLQWPALDPVLASACDNLENAIGKLIEDRN